MKKDITLTSDEICTIHLALQDKIMNTEATARTSGYPMSEQTKRRIESWEALINKIEAAKWK